MRWIGFRRVVRSFVIGGCLAIGALTWAQDPAPTPTAPAAESQPSAPPPPESEPPANDPAPAPNAPPSAPSEPPQSDAPATIVAPPPSAAERDAEYYELYKVFADTFDQVERNYVKDVSRRELMEAAIQGVLEQLDPYSNYIGPEELSRFKTSVEHQFGGIGIQVTMEQGELRVLSPLVGSPAYRAGLQAGDQILEIAGESTTQIALDEAVRRMKGEAGTDVTLTIRHAATNERETLTIRREIIELDTVLGDRRNDSDQWEFLYDAEQRVGYIRLTAFSRDTARDLERVLEQLEDQGMRALVLDLRFNPGGLLSSAIEVADLFVSQGRIVSTAGRNSPERSWDARERGTFAEFPMAVLVNRYSASASEIVAACLQDHGRAIVVGERTWGKGSVQNVIELEGGRSALKLTTAGYQRPSGKKIHRFPEDDEDDEWGVHPTEGFEVRLPDAEMVALMEDRRERDILKVNHSEAGRRTGPQVAAAASAATGEPTSEPAAEPATPPAIDAPPAADSPPNSSPPDAATVGEPPAPAAAEPPQATGEDPKPEDSAPQPEVPTSPTEGSEAPAAVEPTEPAPESAPAADRSVADRQMQRAVAYLREELAKVAATAN